MKRQEHFTLIELLVVIAIIAILAGMLLPALNNAREKGRGSYCINTNKQLVGSVQQYTDDFQGWIPGRNTMLNTSGYANDYFLSELATLYGAFPRVGYKYRSFWICPSTPSEAVNALMQGKTKKGTEGRAMTYGINSFAWLQKSKWGLATKIKSPSRCAATGDSALGDTADLQYFGDAVIDRNTPEVIWRRQFRHGSSDTANYTFWDGHAEARKYTMVPNTLISSSSAKMTSSYFWQMDGVSSTTNEFSHM